jgi:hypothetical protein
MGLVARWQQPGYSFDTEEEAQDALEQLWLDDKAELESEHADDHDYDDDDDDEDDKKNDADGDLIFADGEAWRYDEITKERWSREEDKVLEVENSFDCYADEAAFLEQFKEIEYL